MTTDSFARILASKASVSATLLADTVASAATTTISSNNNFVRTAGYTAPGDDGAALYKRVGTQPSHLGKFQSADGAWWEIAEAVVRPQMFGARGDANPDNPAAGTNDSVAVQNALNYLALFPGKALALGGDFFKIQNVRIPARAEGRRWFIYGEGGGFVNPATATSESPCLFHSSLAASGDAARTYEYSDGVTLNDVNFHGGGYGVGYAHLIAGHLHHENCSFQKLEDGLLTIGVAGIAGTRPRALLCKRAFHAALKADYAFTAGYTQEVSTGWNDGYFIRGGSITKCERGLVHKGSTSEGVVGIHDMIWTFADLSYVETYGLFKAVDVSHNWCEYTKADASGAAVADCIRFWRSTGADVGGESAGQFSVHHNNFFFTAATPVGGVNTYAVRRCIDARVNCHVYENAFTCSTGGLVDVIIYNSIGSSGTPIAKASITPNSLTTFNTSGVVGFADADLAQFGDVQSILYMLHDNGKSYILTWKNQPSVGTQNYDVHAFSSIYSPQFAAVSAQWGVKTSQTLRTAPVGISCDFSVNVTGLTAPVGAVSVWSGINGGVVDASGNGTGGLITIERNTCQNIDMRLFYAQTNSGRYVMRDNIKRT